MILKIFYSNIMEPRRRCLYQMSLRQKHQELYRPIDYIKKYLGGDIPHDGLYEASQNIACVKDDKYFVNQQIGTYREFHGRPGVVPNLFEIGNSAIVSEGISLALDINNRYQYIYQNKKNSINDCLTDVNMIFSLLIENISRWE